MALHHPALIRLMCTLLVRDGTPSGIVTEMMLFDAVTAVYPGLKSPFPAPV